MAWLGVVGCSVVGSGVCGFCSQEGGKEISQIARSDYISSCTYHMHFLNWNELTVGPEVGSTVDTRVVPKIDSVIG